MVIKTDILPTFFLISNFLVTYTNNLSRKICHKMLELGHHSIGRKGNDIGQPTYAGKALLSTSRELFMQGTTTRLIKVKKMPQTDGWLWIVGRRTHLSHRVKDTIMHVRARRVGLMRRQVSYHSTWKSGSTNSCRTYVPLRRAAKGPGMEKEVSPKHAWWRPNLAFALRSVAHIQVLGMLAVRVSSARWPKEIAGQITPSSIYLFIMFGNVIC